MGSKKGELSVIFDKTNCRTGPTERMCSLFKSLILPISKPSAVATTKDIGREDVFTGLAAAIF
jgi:hypothetical protein